MSVDRHSIKFRLWALRVIERDLVFVGGGHTHALVIRRLAMRPIPNVRITLISEQTLTPYSGMLPGFVAGHYSLEETHIDLNRLCQWANVRWIKGTVSGIDLDHKTVTVRNQSSISYDKLSIDTGSTPDLSVPGAADFAVGVKPVSRFNEIWGKLLRASEAQDVSEWGVIGAGAGGVELVLAMAHRLRAKKNLRLHLLYSGDHVLPGYPQKLVEKVEQALADFSVQCHPGFKVASVTASGLQAQSGDTIQLDKSIWCTGAAAAPWPAESGLDVSGRGFISVNSYLQSTSHADVYAVGDCSDMLDDPRPKAGVYAVRQAPFLDRNLRASLTGGAMKRVKLQSDFLSLLSLGDRSAVGCRLGWVASGKWVWKLKHAIDAKFMSRLNEPAGDSGGTMAMAAATADSDQPMHCAGCGSKLGPDLIRGNLAALPMFKNEAVTPALATAEDASLWRVPAHKTVVQSIDGFRSFSNDPARFGAICVNHSLSDLYAMGATPVSAQVWINLVFSHPRIQKRDHKLMMSGIAMSLEQQQVTLAGGHSTEGAESHVAVVANGEIAEDAIWRKNHSQADDVLVLTKPLGTGTILAADMQARAPARAVDAAFDCMLESNREAAQLLSGLQPSAVTDVTGFGLLGHLLEMLADTNVRAELQLAEIPLLEGALELTEEGHQSTLYPQLQPFLLQCATPSSWSEGSDIPAAARLLLDPQTSGGLLVSMQRSLAEQFIESYPSARIVGRITAAAEDEQAVTIL
ncbi:selenide, water dikinase SelD [Chromatiales bacterium (ex Bugula neritina AB1)]|nr:selenide, water dikinase SelD [Chromatiales bacterium (ex Bugula neritina AB1)]